jgi:hypothetical protein
LCQEISRIESGNETRVNHHAIRVLISEMVQKRLGFTVCGRDEHSALAQARMMSAVSKLHAFELG